MVFKETATIHAAPSSSRATAIAPLLEPGEIPRSLALSSSALSSAAAIASVGLTEQPVAVFQHSTGALVSADKWPLLKNLASWLDKHPDYNVHSTSASLAAVC